MCLFTPLYSLCVCVLFLHVCVSTFTYDCMSIVLQIVLVIRRPWGIFTCVVWFCGFRLGYHFHASSGGFDWFPCDGLSSELGRLFSIFFVDQLDKTCLFILWILFDMFLAMRVDLSSGFI